MHEYQASARRVSRKREPAWEIAELFPYQGMWDEEDYLALQTNRRVELVDGCVEVLPMPTTSHEALIRFLFKMLAAFVEAGDLGEAFFSGIRLRLWPGRFRFPDIIFVGKEHDDYIMEEYWQGADLVMEVVSNDPKDRHSDLVKKRRDYARGRVPEYWIVDPLKETITVLRLAGKSYVVHGKFTRGQTAVSHLLPGFSVSVTQAFTQRHARKGSPARKRPSD